MLSSIQDFFNNNKIMLIMIVIGLVSIVGFLMLRRTKLETQAQSTERYQDIGRELTSDMGHEQNNHMQTQLPHDMEGLDNVNMVCDLANGDCNQSEMHNHEVHNIN